MSPLRCLWALAFGFLPVACDVSGRTDRTESDAESLGDLGTVVFPTSAKSEEAHSHFLRGVAALHSFWYEVALEEFQAASALEPEFAMAYWGEAMTHNHPIWGDPQETEAARLALARMPASSPMTEDERAWMDAVNVLYGPGEKEERDRAYANKMEELFRRDPEDPEAALFYALALMGTVRPEDPEGIETRLRAGAIAEGVFRSHPDHPGAAHYVIHAYDDPENAGRALEAARRYSRIAPASPHALHMPSHIFLQLGMWPEAAESNEASWAASTRWVQKKRLGAGKRDYHSLHWLQYIYLQQGRYGEARELLAEMDRGLAEIDPSDARNLAFAAFTRAQMAAAFVIETEDWDSADDIAGETRPAPKDAQSATGDVNPFAAFAVVSEIPLIFARGLAQAAAGSPEARESARRLRSIRESSDVREPFVAAIVQGTEVQELEIEGLASAFEGDLDDAIRILRKASAIEAAFPPPPGPPPLLKPSHELLGELLLRARRPQEAAKEFEVSLLRHKARARSLLGLARTGDKDASSRFLEQWSRADASLPELSEARKHTR
jgi:tetratricopeptide (TPR) repeat protein